MEEQYVPESHRVIAMEGQNTHMKLNIGTDVMVTNNVETDLDITNSTRGETVDIVLHAEEPALGTDRNKIVLKHVPICILVTLSRTRAGKVEGLKDCMIPME